MLASKATKVNTSTAMNAWSQATEANASTGTNALMTTVTSKA